MSGPQWKTTRAAILASEKKLTEFKRLLISSLSKWEMSFAQRKLIAALSGAGRTTAKPMLSDFKARSMASKLLIRLMKRHWKKSRKKPSRRYFFLTFIDDMGNTLDRKPEVNLAALRRKIDKAIRNMGLDALVAIECQAIMNYPAKGHGRTLMYHGHGIGWTDDPDFCQVEQAEALNNSRAWNNAFGADPAHIREMTDQAGEIEWLAHYMLKLPNDVKNLMPKHGHPGRTKFMSTTKGYRPELALRIWEGLSQIRITEAVFGVGAGKHVRKAWKKQLMRWHKGRLGRRSLASDFDTAAFWRALRRNNGSAKFRPYRFLKGSERPQSVHGVSIAKTERGKRPSKK